MSFNKIICEERINNTECSENFTNKGESFLVDIYTLLLILVGSFGNIISLIVIFKRKPHKPSSLLPASKVITDTLYLIALYFWWLDVHINIFKISYSCKILSYFSTLFCSVSVWIVVASSVESYLTLNNLLKHQNRQV